MNKPIIIDGCNVAECQQLVIKKSGKHYCYDYFNGFCEDNKDCYFKQLQRLEAKNEELKRKNTILESVTEPQRQEIGKYKDKALKFKHALEEIREWLQKWQFDANIIKHTNEPLNLINEVLKDD